MNIDRHQLPNGFDKYVDDTIKFAAAWIDTVDKMYWMLDKTNVLYDAMANAGVPEALRTEMSWRSAPMNSLWMQAIERSKQ